MALRTSRASSCWFAVLVVAGCGRVGFEPSLRDASGGSEARCTARTVPGFALGMTGASDLAATRMPDGFALGVVVAPGSTFWGVRLDAAFVPNAAAPFHTSPVSGLDGSYDAASLWWDGANVVGALSEPGDMFFQKTFAADLSTFTWNSPKLAGRAGEPSVAASGGVNVSSWSAGSSLSVTALMANGQSAGNPVTVDTAPAAITQTSSAGGPVAVVAMALADGSCRVASIGADFSSVARPLRAAPCSAPHAVRDGETFTIAYERGGLIAASVVQVSQAPLQISIDGERDLVAGTTPRLVRFGAERFLAWIAEGRLHLAHDGERLEERPIVGLPAAAPDTYEVADDAVFAVFGSELWAITCAP